MCISLRWQSCVRRTHARKQLLLPSRHARSNCMVSSSHGGADGVMSLNQDDTDDDLVSRTGSSEGLDPLSVDTEDIELSEEETDLGNSGLELTRNWIEALMKGIC